MRYDRVTRGLHALFAVTVVTQLVTGLIMHVPHPGRSISPIGNLFFEIHRWSGLSTACFMLLHWVWLLSGHLTEGWMRLFPWFSSEGRRQVLSGLRTFPAWILGKPGGEADLDRMAGAVHGLGLVVVSAMAGTGTAIFFGMAPSGAEETTVAIIREIHGFLAGFVVAYLAGHVGMAVLHQYRGERIITRMFSFGADPDSK